jgi:hypothetical protein
MRVYHYLETGAYEALRRTGWIVGSPKHSEYANSDQFERAYGWLANVMERRIGPAPSHCHPGWPVFGWVLHNGMTPLEYDRFREKPRSGDRCDASFLVGFDVPDGSYVLSDFDDWHFVLNNWFLPSCGSALDDVVGETEAFDILSERYGYDRTGSPGANGRADEVEAVRRSNWERIVDRPYENASVQATVWELKWEWVFLVKARRRRAVTRKSDGRSPTSGQLRR